MRKDRDHRSSFEIRRGQLLGDKLIWRYPAGSPEIRRELERAGIGEIPVKATLGYYFQREHPEGAWAFMPVSTPIAIAALSIEMVQVRVAEDLQILLRAGEG